MLTLLYETTKWPDRVEGNRGGVYVFESKPKTRLANCLGYISPLTDEVKWFKAPLVIDTKNRQFVEVGHVSNSIRLVG